MNNQNSQLNYLKKIFGYNDYPYIIWIEYFYELIIIGVHIWFFIRIQIVIKIIKDPLLNFTHNILSLVVLRVLQSLLLLDLSINFCRIF